MRLRRCTFLKIVFLLGYVSMNAGADNPKVCSTPGCVSARIDADESITCDLNRDGAINVVDVQLATNMSLGLLECTGNALILSNGRCRDNTDFIEKIKQAALGGRCHSAIVEWKRGSKDPPGETYNVYRSSMSGGPYTKITTAPVSTSSYTDGGVLSGKSYFYVITAILGGLESAYSSELAVTASQLP